MSTPSPSYADVRQTLSAPPSSCRPTPLYWWTGEDLDPDRLKVQLAALAEKGIGGTIVGYSHLPDGGLDHGNPAPLSPNWWTLFRGFTEESARLGMTVGIQDYGINGPILLAAGKHTQEFHPGMLRHRLLSSRGPGHHTEGLDEAVPIAVVVAPAEPDTTAGSVPEPIAIPFDIDSTTLQFDLPDGVWDISIVLRADGAIGSNRSTFDPLHPDAGQLVINTLYQPFADHLGDHFGTTFTTFFQDELDFGLRMPLWNDQVAQRLRDSGFEPAVWLPALWRDVGPKTLPFRAAYRDVVLALLEDHYFKPIFHWHRAHSTAMYMDQISRGDLRAGRRHYGDYLQTMRWYDGPGNDDPDLTTPRSVAAFKISTSLARLNKRPIVASEAFHSSGWGITPEQILAGLNAGFAYGVNHVIMHGLDYTSSGGWWEWASPDFHFRQPWWQHSDALWNYITRTSALLRIGAGVADIAVLDPTQDLDLSGDSATSPEYARQVLTTLAEAGHDCDLLDRIHLTEAVTREGRLEIGDCRYRAVIVPDMRALRDDALQALQRFAAAGGLLIVLGDAPATTELGSCAGQPWSSASHLDATALPDLPRWLSQQWEPDFDARGSGLVASHRRDGDVDLYLIVNVSDHHVTNEVDLRTEGHTEIFNAWTGEVTSATLLPAPNKLGSGRIKIDLAAGLATFVVVDRSRAATSVGEPATPRPEETAIEGPWEVQTIPCLDNRYGDFEYGGEPLGVETWRVETADSSEGPWSPGMARCGPAFLVLGPVPADRTDDVQRQIAALPPKTSNPIALDGLDLSWRTYDLSYVTGIPDDPLLLDRMTGPHGLKYVPDEFLDPAHVDPEPPSGSVYYFWSTVPGDGTDLTVSVGSRAAHKLWIDNEPVLEQAEEVPAFRTPAWGLRDLSVTNQTRSQVLPPGRRSALLRLHTATGQPTRASVALGHTLPASPPRARLRWWHGDQPCLRYDPYSTDPGETVWLRLTSPPGTVAAELRVQGEVRSATVASSGAELIINAPSSTDPAAPFTLRPVEPLTEADELLIEVGATEFGYHGAAVLTEPVRWTLTAGRAPSSSFLDHGLGEFSGLVRYSQSFVWQGATEKVLMNLPGLESSAMITLNGSTVGTLLTATQQVDVSRALRKGSNTIEIEVANTMINRFSILPSPFVRMQQAGGGFQHVLLRTEG